MNSVIDKLDNGMHYCIIHPTIANKLLKTKEKRWICVINKTTSFHVALQSNKEGNYFIYVGSKILKQLNLKKGMAVQIDFKKDDTTYQFEDVEEWNEVMNTDPEVEIIFNQLTPGNKRSILFLIQQVKSSDKRIQRSLIIAENLKKGIHSPKLLLK